MMSSSPSSIARVENDCIESSDVARVENDSNESSDILKETANTVETAYSRFADENPSVHVHTRRRRKAYGSALVESREMDHTTNIDLLSLAAEILGSREDNGEMETSVFHMDLNTEKPTGAATYSEDNGFEANLIDGENDDEKDATQKMDLTNVSGRLVSQYSEHDGPETDFDGNDTWKEQQQNEDLSDEQVETRVVSQPLEDDEVADAASKQDQHEDDLSRVPEIGDVDSNPTDTTNEKQAKLKRKLEIPQQKAPGNMFAKIPPKDDLAEQPDEDDLIASIDNLFIHADKQSVTVGDIVRFLEVEYGVALTKALRKQVRNRLTDLITGKVEPSVSGYVGEVGDAESEPDASDKEADDEQSDFEDEKGSTKRNRNAHRKRAKHRPSNPRRKHSPKKSSALKIKAERLRKQRMEELKVRNEELQLNQSKEDQERAELIAAKFETNTDELRLKRLEDRLDLLAKLDKKRIDIIQENIVGKKEILISISSSEIDEQRPLTLVASKDDGSVRTAATPESDSEDELELEIIGFKKTVPVAQSAPSAISSVTSSLGNAHKTLTSRRKQWSSNGTNPQTSPGRSRRVRASLRHTLLARQRRAGNMWLARELGYKTEEEHLRDCLLVEQKKRELVIKKEEERLRANERKALRQRLLMNNPENDQDDQLGTDEENGDEEDEELALARKIQGETNSHGENDDIESKNRDSNLDYSESDLVGETVNMKDSTRVVSPSEGSTTPSSEFRSKDSDAMAMRMDFAESADDADLDLDANTLTETGNLETQPPIPQEFCASMGVSNPPTLEGEDCIDMHSGELTKVKPNDSLASKQVYSGLDDASLTPNLGFPDSDTPESTVVEKAKIIDDSETDQQTEKANIKKGPRNAAWQALLKKEALHIKKLKKQRAGLVEAEAEEEEEEEVAGLEDFGFVVNKGKRDDDEDEQAADKLDEEDLKHIVDEVSDNEGDEEAGEKGRRELERQEEKLRHKEVLRRMREGYDGRRGGIAGAGFGARGIHRFDQLVAADNREDAKMLGLLNDDELDSEDEKDGDDGNGKEEDDEAALLDKVLKDRFLHRSSVDLEENFSADEDEDIDENAESNVASGEDDEEREQERLAKRFAKRARMHRLLEVHGEDEEFSRSRLIEEDEAIRQELINIKNVLANKRTVSASSSSRSSMASGSDTTPSVRGPWTNAFGAPVGKGGNLSLALQANRRNKPKTSFLGLKGSVSSTKDQCSSTMGKFVARSGHVLFHTAASADCNSLLSAASLSNSTRQSAANRSSNNNKNNNTGKRKRDSPGVATSSLWNKVSANSFRNKRS